MVSLLLKYSIYNVYLVCTRSCRYEIIYRLKMSLKLLLAIFLLFSTYFNKSPSVTAVTKRVVTASTKTQVDTKMVKTKKKGTYHGNQTGGNQGWKPPTSELTNVTFGYGTRMNTEEFKQNVSLIPGKVAEKIKHGTKDVVKACNTGISLVMAEPNDPG